MLINRNYNNKFVELWWKLDKTIFICFVFLICIGILLVSTSSLFIAYKIKVNLFYFIKNHLMYLAVFLVLMFFVLYLTQRQLIYFIIIGFLASLVLTGLVFLVGSEIKGAKRWLYLGGISLQPSELIKAFFSSFIVYVFLFLQNKFNNKLKSYLAVSGVYGVIIFFLLLQPDFGMTILITALFISFLFISGVSLKPLIAIFSLVTILAVGVYFLLPHVAYRVNSFFDSQAGYQVNKAMNAIYNGKLLGTGPGQGVVKEFLPDSHTDFIFTVATEELGVLFNLLIILLYATVLVRCIIIAKSFNDSFKSLALVMLAITLCLQAVIHMLSNVNLIPTKGMTLPLVSYGGSSLLSSIIVFALILALSKKQIE